MLSKSTNMWKVAINKDLILVINPVLLTPTFFISLITINLILDQLSIYFKIRCGFI